MPDELDCAAATPHMTDDLLSVADPDPRATQKRVAERDYLADWWDQDRLVASHGSGAWVYDTMGKAYLDAVGGSHVVTIGHGVAEVADAIQAQAARLAFANARAFTTEPQLLLAEHIASIAPPHMNRCYFASGGSEAIELAMQLAYYWQTLRGRGEKVKFIGQLRAHHGATLATVSLGGHYRHRQRLAPYLFDFLHAPATPAYDADTEKFVQALDALIVREGAGTICAFVAETISGSEAGVAVPPKGWYEAVRALCDHHDILFIADEVITGFGRTGTSFGIDHWNATPDLMVGAKGLASGYAPLSVVIVHDRIAEAFMSAPGRIPVRFTSTAHPPSCAAALAVQQYIQSQNLIERCRRIGAMLATLLADLARSVPCVGPPRGLGLLLAVPLWQDADERRPFPRAARVYERVVETALDLGVLLIGGFGTETSVDGDFLVLTPPFVLTESDAATLVETLYEAITRVVRS
jgi:adenosylmethionine-8-amino-7-oxononanoate aminotransferase